jgi:hypothetical protein
METFIGIILSLLAIFVVYMQMHIMEEQRKGTHIPLPWEKGDDNK